MSDFFESEAEESGDDLDHKEEEEEEDVELDEEEVEQINDIINDEPEEEAPSDEDGPRPAKRIRRGGIWPIFGKVDLSVCHGQ